MNKYKRQLGFGAVEIVIALVIVGAVGFVGWRVYDSQVNKQQAAQPTNEQPKEEQKPEETPAEEAKFLTYTNSKYGYQFQYPKTWTTATAKLNEQGATEATVKAHSLLIRSPDFKSSNAGIGYHIAKGGQLQVNVGTADAKTIQEELKDDGFFQNVARDRKTVVVEGKPALQYRVSYESLRVLTTAVVKDGFAYYISLEFADETALNTYKKDYEAFLASFKFVAK